MTMGNINNSRVWIFKKLITCFDKFYIENLNIWDYKWIHLDEFVTVEDPKYKPKYNAQVLSIVQGDTTIYFLAVEFSNTNWGIYLKDDYETKLINFA